MVFLYVLVTLVSTAIVWAGSDLLERSSERLATHYGLPPIVQGAIIAAVGSSFPEFSSTVLSTALHGEFALGVGIITGSAIFNILVIPGISGLVAGGSLQTSRDLVYKEAQFYMLSVAALLLIFSFAVIYYPTDRLHGKVTRGLALFPLGLYCLYVFLQYMDTRDYEPEGAGAGEPWKEWGRLLLGMLFILVGVEGLIRAALAFGRIFNTPTFLWGVTVMAVATSIPDTFVSVKAARGGRGLPSLSNVLGSNIFDLLVCIPVGILIAGATAIDFSVAAPLLGFLVVATLTLFVFTRTHLCITRLEAILLILFYGVFLIWMTLETVGITSYVL